ncbi:MAG: CBS domain-containing protein [Ignavibacteriae bacterium]|nr:CBS domain-containing protein [Ignavibacteriota bacterium]
MKPISEIMGEKPIFSISREKTVADAARYMAEKNVGAIPVVENNRLVGIFSERDVITRVIARGLDPTQASVSDVMTTKIVVANADEGYESCLAKMQKAHCRHMPIVAGEQLIGFVSLRDLLMVDLDEKERNLEYLQSYIYTVPPGAAKKYETNS